MKILRPIAILVSCLVLTASARRADLADAARRRHAAGAEQTGREAESKGTGSGQETSASHCRAETCGNAGADARAGRDRDACSAPAPDDPNVDLVYGAYQRGLYKTAFDLATKRVQDTGDPKAMTMLGELYANAMGVKRDYAKAADWYKRAADRGDREAMFALAMLRLAGRGGPVDREEAAEIAGVVGQARQPEGGL